MVKCDFVISECICTDIPPQMKMLNMVIPHSNALLQFCLKLKHCKPHNAAYHPTKCDVINDVKLFPTVYRRFCMYTSEYIKVQKLRNHKKKFGKENLN